MKDKQNRIKELEKYLREHNAANFIEAVLNEDNAEQLVMSLSAFYEEPELLYRALEYASYRNRSVTIVPLTKEGIGQ